MKKKFLYGTIDVKNIILTEMEASSVRFNHVCLFERIKDEYWLDKDSSIKLRDLRNKIIHEPDKFSKSDARNFLESLKKLMPKADN